MVKQPQHKRKVDAHFYTELLMLKSSKEYLYNTNNHGSCGSNPVHPICEGTGHAQ